MAAEKTKSASKKQKVEKTRKAPKAKAQKASSRSQEFVVDSEDEDAPPENRKVKEVVPPTSASKATSKPSSKAKKSSPPVPAPKPSSSQEEESEEESDDDSLPDAPVPQKPTQVPAKVNGVKRTAEEQSTDESEEESEEDSEGPETKKARIGEEEEGASESSEEEENNEGEPEVPSEKQKQTPAPKPKNPTAAPQPPKSLPALPFKPPTGYNAVDMVGVGTTVPESFLAGKQIWHITAPSDVPLSSVKEVAWDAIQTSQCILSHKGADYILNEENVGDSNHAIFLPSKDGYTPIRQRVDKTLHLQQKIVLPNLSSRQANPLEGSAAAADVAEPAVSSVRPQPKGLRMRYKPIGFGEGQPGMITSASDDEETSRKGPETSFQFPRTLGVSDTKQPTTTNGAKKSKKKRKEKQTDPIQEDVDKDVDMGEAVAGADVSHEKGVSETVALQPQMKVVAPEAGEEKAEKARKKEEKRRKREAKANKAKAEA